MLQMILPEGSSSLLAFFGILFAFGATVLATAKLSPYLPKDAGREFAHDGKLSAGKPRGAGIIFVLAFVASVLLFSPLSAELVIYLLLIVVCMMTGFLDDASKTPWGEYKKGFLDLCVAALVAITFLKYNSNVVELALFHVKFTLPSRCATILQLHRIDHCQRQDDLDDSKAEYGLRIGPVPHLTHMIMQGSTHIFQNMNLQEAEQGNLKQSQTSVQNQHQSQRNKQKRTAAL